MVESARGVVARTGVASGAATVAHIVTLLIVVALGVTQLPTPFGGDQALFALGAQSIERGAVLYRDFWDIKQPGIFYFYALAGRAFGHGAAAIHAFELLYELAFCAVLIGTLRARFASPVSVCVAVFVAVGIPYAVADAWELTQVELLAGFPLYVAIWCAAAAARARPAAATRLAVCAGVAAAAAVLLKALFIAIVIAAWMPAALTLAQRRRPHAFAAVWFAAALGLCVPLAVVAAGFVVQHAGALAWETTFDLPRRIATSMPQQPYAVLATSIGWFVRAFAPAIVLAVYGAVSQLRRARDTLTFGVLIWLFAGAAVFLAQRQSWWSYQTLLVATPIGIFAAAGVDRLLHARPARRRVLFAALALVIAAVPLRATLQRVAILKSYGYGISATERAAYASAVSPAYRAARASAAFLLRPDAMPGPVYVAGNPLVYTIARRRQAVAINGWLLEVLPPAQWAALTAQLERAQPVYLYAWNGYAATFARAPHGFADFLARRYHVAEHDSDGTWYARDTPLGIAVPHRARQSSRRG